MLYFPIKRRWSRRRRSDIPEYNCNCEMGAAVREKDIIIGLFRDGTRNVWFRARNIDVPNTSKEIPSLFRVESAHRHPVVRHVPQRRTRSIVHEEVPGFRDVFVFQNYSVAFVEFSCETWLRNVPVAKMLARSVPLLKSSCCSR